MGKPVATNNGGKNIQKSAPAGRRPWTNAASHHPEQRPAQLAVEGFRIARRA